MADETDLPTDEQLVLREYRTLKAMRHGDLDISVKDARLVKLWKVDKVDLSALDRKIREVGR